MVKTHRAKRRFYTPEEVAQHRSSNDVWLCVGGHVLDLTDLVQRHLRGGKGLHAGEAPGLWDPLGAAPLVAAGGTDVTHWFQLVDEATGEGVAPPTGVMASDDVSRLRPHLAVLPTTSSLPMARALGFGDVQGRAPAAETDGESGEIRVRFLHCPPELPDAGWWGGGSGAGDYGPASAAVLVPWWCDPQYRIGQMSQRTRRVRVVNALTQARSVLQIASEETVAELALRYDDELLLPHDPANQPTPMDDTESVVARDETKYKSADDAYNERVASAKSRYVWKYQGRVLDPDGTLELNDIPDETELLGKLSIGDDDALPALHAYFKANVTGTAGVFTKIDTRVETTQPRSFDPNNHISNLSRAARAKLAGVTPPGEADSEE